MRFNSRMLGLAFCVCSGLVIVSCSRHDAPFAPPPRIVHTAHADVRTIPQYIDTFGTLAAYSTVDLKSEVTGKIYTNHFLEGEAVTQGQVLFTIEKDDYISALNLAQAQLEKSEAERKNALDTYTRKKNLYDQAVISEVEYEQAITELRAREADVQIATAQKDQAQRNLDRCSIRSPLTGVTGQQYVDAGNIVPAHTGPTLVTIKRIDPLLLDFTVPEKYTHVVRNAIARGDVYVILTQRGGGSTYTGVVDFVQNEVSTHTGTLFLRAVVPNAGYDLWPGQFTHVRMVYDHIQDAVIVPEEAVRMGRDGYYVCVIRPDDTTDIRFVTRGLPYGDYRQIIDNIAGGEEVVTVGQIALSPGAPVTRASEGVSQ